jgi:hypothetical protein
MTVKRSPKSEPLRIEGPAGSLQCLLETPDTAVSAVAVVCHPHPQHGGTMDNKVAYSLARSFYHLGAAAIRFNFRGVGESAGEFAQGCGEIEDAKAVAAWARERWPEQDLYLAGFSFGSMVALGAAQALPIKALITVAPAVQRIPGDFARPSCPWLIVQGGQDEIVASSDVLQWSASFDPQPQLVVMPGVGHFFDGQLTPLREAVTRFLQTHGL